MALGRLLRWLRMKPNLTALRALEELEQALADTRREPLLLFKHSHSCGISAEALDELLTHIGGRPNGVRYAMVTVQTHRDVSNAVSTLLGVRHETPQAILVCDGRAVWTASHFRVNAAELEKAIQTAI